MANKVIAGDYTGRSVSSAWGSTYIVLGAGKMKNLDKGTVDEYEVITEDHRKSAVSGITRGLVGGVLLGPVGLLGGLSAKNKGTYQVAIKWKNGGKSLVEIDDKIY